MRVGYIDERYLRKVNGITRIERIRIMEELEEQGKKKQGKYGKWQQPYEIRGKTSVAATSIVKDQKK